MTEQRPILQAAARDPKVDAIIKLAVMAVGGQGGGVLTNWIEDVARESGYAVQATSVAGVAQRTGATIYYIEMAPSVDQPPVFSLMPAAGDVDILVAAEMMEAGRAIMRGFVTPDRTTLIASTHRALAVSEKTVPGDGIANAEEVMAAGEVAARRFLAFDLEALALSEGSVISASLFGALAGAAVLPFSRAAFEDAIRRSGRGVDASLRAFARGYEAAETGQGPARAARPKDPTPGYAPTGNPRLIADWEALLSKAQALPEAVRETAMPGLRKVVDFMDPAYGRAYLDRVQLVLAQDNAARGHLLTREAAKYIANAMAYDDVIKVADLKTRATRMERIRRQMNLRGDQEMHLTEFMHPRAEEIAGMMPARMGAWVEARPGRMRLLDRLFNRGRRLRTDGMASFLQLYVIGGLRGYRRRTRRHAIEAAHLERWQARCLAALPDYDLAVELLRCRRLIKGYSDTHSRGLSKFDRVLAGADLVAGRDDAADWLRRLREAALQDEKGEALDGALATIRSFEPQAASAA
ncbi:MAG: indolepyruvate oxidoreductase subunit beta family protein [Pseudomonadota bacterium]